MEERDETAVRWGEVKCVCVCFAMQNIDNNNVIMTLARSLAYTHIRSSIILTRFIPGGNDIGADIDEDNSNTRTRFVENKMTKNIEKRFLSLPRSRPQSLTFADANK